MPSRSDISRTQVRPWHRTSKPRKESRTIPVKGFGADTGKQYRCWHCGFICDEDRDSLGGAESLKGISYTVANGISYGGTSAVLGGITHSFVTLELDSAGDTKTLIRDFTVATSSGCPQCGTLNWRGDYP